MQVLCSSHRTAECVELARQGTVQSELPILVLSTEPDGAHLFVQEVTGPMVIIGLERSGGVVSMRKIVKIVIATSPAPGHVNPMLGIARILMDEGHEVVAFTGSAFKVLMLDGK